MPLLDHFHPESGFRRKWHSFHQAWATYIASDLNSKLPKGYFAEPNVQFGIEIDVGAFDRLGSPASNRWTPPGPTLSIPFSVETDVVEVFVYEASGGAILSGAIELVSSSNKDRPASRDAFASKCQAYVKSGVGLVVIDIVTERHANLHNELMERLDGPKSGTESGLYAASYQAVGRNGDSRLDIWLESLRVGGELPILPFWLKGGLCLPLDLEATYQRTRLELRIDDNV